MGFGWPERGGSARRTKGAAGRAAASEAGGRAAYVYIAYEIHVCVNIPLAVRTWMDRIEDCLSFVLGKAYQHVQQEAKRRLAPYGVTPAQYAVLRVLWEHDGQSAADVGARLVLDSATMTGLVDRLSQAGLVERRPHAVDRRVNLVSLTDAGAALQAPLEAAMDALNEDAGARLGGARLAGLRAMLRDLAQGVAPGAPG
jgi:DNA-binding MarR family transcriptional regulator